MLYGLSFVGAYFPSFQIWDEKLVDVTTQARVGFSAGMASAITIIYILALNKLVFQFHFKKSLSKHFYNLKVL